MGGLTRIAQGVVNTAWNLVRGRAYQAAEYSSHHPHRGDASSGNTAVQRAGTKLREYARWLEENHDLAVAILDELEENVIGTGLHPEPAMRDRGGALVEEFNRELAQLYARWWERPDVTGQYSGAQLERLSYRSTSRDGEVFGVLHTAGAPFATEVPLAIDALESDFCPYDLMMPRNDVIHGIRVGAWRRPVGYHFTRHHPGDLFGAVMSPETTEVPADFVVHPKFVRRLHQLRGVSMLHAVMRRLDDIRDYEEAERVAARVAAAFTAYIRRPFALGAGTTTKNKKRSFRMQPGMVFDELLPGEEVDIIDSKRPNPNLGRFRDDQLRGAAGGTKARFSRVSRNYSGGSYSSQRQEMVESALAFRMLRNDHAAAWHRPVYQAFVRQAVFSGALVLPRELDPKTAFDVEFRGPGLPWIDPKKEIEAYSEAVAEGFMSRRQVIRILGYDPARVDAEQASDTFTPRARTPAAPATPEDNDDAQAAA